MAERLARALHWSHGETAIVHASWRRSCGDALGMLLLWKWHWLLWWHPAICHWWLTRSKHARTTVHGWLLRAHLLLQSQLLHLLLNLCNLSITKYKSWVLTYFCRCMAGCPCVDKTVCFTWQKESTCKMYPKDNRSRECLYKLLIACYQVASELRRDFKLFLVKSPLM